MNEQEITRKLRQVDDRPVEPPDQFRQDLLLMIREEFGGAEPTTGESRMGVEYRAESDSAPPTPVRIDESRASEPTPGRRRSPKVWAFAAGFAAVLLLVGSLALLRFSTADQSPVDDTSADEGVAASPLDGVYVKPTVVPEGMELELVVHGYLDTEIFLSYAPATGAEDANRQEMLIGMSHPRSTDFPPDTATAIDYLSRAYPEADVAETTVRGAPAFSVEVDDPETYGWTTAVVVVESPDLISEVTGRNIDSGAVLDVARGLTTTSRTDFDDWTGAAVDWDLRISASAVDPESFHARIESLPGVVSVTSRPHRPLSLPSVELQRTASQPEATTTSIVDSTLQTTEPEIVELLLSIDPNTDPESIAAAIHDIDAWNRIEYSPQIAAGLTEEYFDGILDDAVVVSREPLIYQPVASLQPQFDTGSLGTEIPLVPADPSDELSASTLSAIASPVGSRSVRPDAAPMEGPILHVGTVGGIRLVLAFDGGVDYAEKDLNASGGWGASGGSFRYYTYGQTGGSSGPDGASITIHVPVETAVVVVEFSDRTVWQRPVAGYSLIPVDIPADTESTAGTIKALDVDGHIIDEWELEASQF